MSDATYSRPAAANHSDLGGAVVYRALFGVVFSFSLLAHSAARLTGHGSDGSVWLEAKRSAHAAAGYALMH
ncbi:MAG: hypothetical protein AAFO68_09100 [Pseudomonadota bacterium]